MKKITSFAILTLLVPFTALGVSYDTTTSYCSVGAASSHSWAHVNDAAATALVVSGDSGGQTISSITYNSAGLTYIQDSTTNRGFQYYIASPSTGSNTVTVNLGASDYIIGASVSFIGSALDATALGDFTTSSNYSGTATSISTLVTSTVANSINVDSVTHQGLVSNPAVTGSNQTSRFTDVLCLAFYTILISTQPATSTAAYTMSWSWTTGRNVDHQVTNIQPTAVAAAAASVIRRVYILN